MCCWPLYSRRNYCFAASTCKCCCTYQLVPLLWVYLFHNSSLHARILRNFKQCVYTNSKHYTTKLTQQTPHHWRHWHTVNSLAHCLLPLTHWHTAYSCTLTTSLAHSLLNRHHNNYTIIKLVHMYSTYCAMLAFNDIEVHVHTQQKHSLFPSCALLVNWPWTTSFPGLETWFISKQCASVFLEVHKVSKSVQNDTLLEMNQFFAVICQITYCYTILSLIILCCSIMLCLAQFHFHVCCNIYNVNVSFFPLILV